MRRNRASMDWPPRLPRPRPQAPTPVQAQLQERVVPRHSHATDAEGRLWDRDGCPWQRVDEFVEPQRALQLVRAGAPWLVDWCGGPLEWPTELPRYRWRTHPR